MQINLASLRLYIVPSHDLFIREFDKAQNFIEITLFMTNLRCVF